MQDILLVIDMQKDFVSGVLGTPEAASIVSALRQKVLDFTGKVYFTRDTHETDYMETREGRYLPVPHCIRNTDGWQIVPELSDLPCAGIIDKPAFGSIELQKQLLEEHERDRIRSVTLTGVCTDICVISNAMLIKAALPEIDVIIDASCCAGVTPSSHQTALAAMKACQMIIIGE